MDSRNNLRHPKVRLLLTILLIGAAFAPMSLLSGCMMTPEDKAFYGRGWINPDELDEDDSTPPYPHNDPTAIPPHMMGPGEY